jgi:hypothetical protein
MLGTINTPVEAESCTYKYVMDVWRKDAMISGNKMDHTATRTSIRQYCGDTKNEFKVIDKCNHGACPGKQNGMSVKHHYVSNAETTEPLYPVGCDFFGPDYDATNKPGQLENYGLSGSRHLCNNDTFLQMG